MIGVLPCSGACNVGQVTSRSIVKKAREDYVAHAALDGRHLACATKALGSVGLQPAAAIEVDRDTGTEKNGDLDDMSALEATTSAVLAAVDRLFRGAS